MTDIEKAELIETLIAQRDMAASEADFYNSQCSMLRARLTATQSRLAELAARIAGTP